VSGSSGGIELFDAAVRSSSAVLPTVSTLLLVGTSPASGDIMLGTACTVPVTRIHACSGSVGMRVLSGKGIGSARDCAGAAVVGLVTGTDELISSTIRLVVGAFSMSAAGGVDEAAGTSAIAGFIAAASLLPRPPKKESVLLQELLRPLEVFDPELGEVTMILGNACASSTLVTAAADEEDASIDRLRLCLL